MAALPLAMCGQDIYMASEFMLLRFHRGYYPPLLATTVAGGMAWELYCSGSTYKLMTWSDARLIYAVGMRRVSLAPGGTLGIAARIEPPSRFRYYFQIGLGMDGHYLRITDGGGSLISDTQLRPIFALEGAYQAFIDRVFLRYGFYPTPGATSKYVFTIGTYIGD